MIILSPWRSCFRQCIASTARNHKSIGSRAASNVSELPSETENARSHLSKSFTSRLDRLQNSIVFASQQLNDLTGYSGIERLKKKIEYQEQGVLDSVQRVKDAKRAYEEAIRTRSESQKEVNELLQRKSTWSALDLERFTTLFRSDHSNSQKEVSTQNELTEAEIKAEQARSDLGNMILARYHEEQIWSDKIRRASTWGTWGLMGFNIFLFVIVQLALEPWKRARLVDNFEDKVRRVVQEQRSHSETGTAILGGETFLSDADHAASGYDHDATIRIGFEAAAKGRPTRADTGTEVPKFTPANGLEDPTDLETSFQQSERLDELDIHSSVTSIPRSSTSAMLSLPTTLAHIRLLFSQHLLQSHLRSAWKRIGSSVSHLLSEERVNLRIGDVTVSCLASAIVGIGIGIGMMMSTS